MQIDFHYGVVYVISRLAGMDAARAEIVAHSCQYVDDAADSDVWGSNRARLSATSRGHYATCARWAEFGRLNPLSWPAFHFIPGGEGSRFDEKVVCRPNSPLAIAAVQRAIEERGSDTGLYRLGVALHSYVDTWAHQGFSGTVSRHNVVLFLEGEDPAQNALSCKLQHAFNTAGATAAAWVLDLVSRLGHGAALSYPDMPWMKWGYRNADNQRIDRDNLQQFMLAADLACKAVRGYLQGNARFENEPGLGAEERKALERLLENNRERNGHQRLATIISDVSLGKIPGLVEHIPPYVASGPGSWDQAAGHPSNVAHSSMTTQRLELFEQSDHRRVLSAILQHRLDLINEILPANNIVLT